MYLVIIQQILYIMLLLVFDTETTGIIPKNVSDIDKCPYILQFSYIVYNTIHSK